MNKYKYLNKLVLLSLLFFAITWTSFGQTPYFYDDCETSNPMSFWVKASGMTYTINEFGLSTDRAVSGSKSIKLDVTLDGSYYIYFKIPIGIRYQVGQSYYASANLYVDTFPSDSTRKVGVGQNVLTWYTPDRDENVGGCHFFDDTDSASSSWIYMESQELRREAMAKAISNGQPSDTIDIEYIYLGIEGTFNNDRVVVYLDDIKLDSTTVAPPITVNVDSYSIANNHFPFGLYGTVGGQRTVDASGTFDEWFPEPLWRAVPVWRKNYINTIIGGTYRLMADSTSPEYDDLKTLLDCFEVNNLLAMPMTYMTRYYRSDLSYATCELAIGTEIPPFVSHNALLGWYIIDEPADSVGALNDYLWGKEKFKNEDTAHPIVTGGSNYSYLFARHRPVSIFDRYPLRDNLYAPWSIGGMTRMIREDSSGPVWFIPQAFGNINGEYLLPTPAELQLMCYTALANGAKGLLFYIWRSRPYWNYPGDISLVDPFEVGNTLWNTIGNLGYHLTAIGPMLLNSSPVELDITDSNAPIHMLTPTMMEITWQEQVPVISIGLLADDNDPDVHYVIFYNNDPNQTRTEDFEFTSAFTAGRDMFDLYQPKNTGNPTVFSIQLAPGEGRIFMLAPGSYFSGVQEQILETRYTHQKEVLKYDLYFAHLAGVAPAELACQFMNVETTDDLNIIQTALDAAINADTTYTQVSDDLDAIQAKLSLLHHLYVDKVTTLESLNGSNNYYVVREFDPADSTVYDYVVRLKDLGHLYFTAKNLFSRGTYSSIATNVQTLKTWSDSLYSSAYASFTTGPVTEQPLSVTDINAMKTTLDDLLASATPNYPDPTSMTAGWVLLTSDSFETSWGSYADGERFDADCERVDYPSRAYDADKAILIRDDSGTASSFSLSTGIDVTGYDKIQVDFDFYSAGMDSGENFLVEYWDGTQWNTVGDFSLGTDFNNDEFTRKSVTVVKGTNSGEYTFPTDMKIRFRCDASDDDDCIYIDNIKISAK